MNDLIDTPEMYLRTILELHEEGIEPLRARSSSGCTGRPDREPDRGPAGARWAADGAGQPAH